MRHLESCVYNGRSPELASASEVPPSDQPCKAQTPAGRYYIAYRKYQEGSCDTVATGTALSPSDSAIAVVDVIPTASVTWEAVTLTGIAVAPAQVSPGEQITATFSWNMPASGTIGKGFNTDATIAAVRRAELALLPLHLRCRGQPGRYYLSVDNPTYVLRTHLHRGNREFLGRTSPATSA